MSSLKAQGLKNNILYNLNKIPTYLSLNSVVAGDVAVDDVEPVVDDTPTAYGPFLYNLSLVRLLFSGLVAELLLLLMLLLL